MRILEYEVRAHEAENEYNAFFTKKATDGFILAFHLFCEKCKFDDFVKIANTGWQRGSIEEKTNRRGSPGSPTSREKT